MPVGAVELEEEPPLVPQADALGALEWWPLPDNVVMMGWEGRAEAVVLVDQNVARRSSGGVEGLMVVGTAGTWEIVVRSW